MKRCSRCKNTRPREDFSKNRTKKDGLFEYCKPCAREYNNRRYKTNPRVRAQVRASDRQRPEDAAWRTFNYTLRKRGLTLDQYHAMLEAQEERCAICQEYKPLVIDHHHGSGKVRALLCSLCNTGIGSLKDSAEVLRAAADYIEAHA